MNYRSSSLVKALPDRAEEGLRTRLAARAWVAGGALLKTVVDAGVPVLAFGAMLVVGMELTADDFRRVARQPAIVVAAIVGQVVLLPATGWLLVRSLTLQPAIAQGVLLVVACPGGAMANIYTYLARGNVALSVTLTAVSCLVAALTTPVAMAIFRAQDGESAAFAVPYGVLAGQLVVLLVLPVLSGMGIRRRWPDVTSRHARTLLGLSIATLAALLGFIIVKEAEQFASALTELATAAGVLTVLAFAAGWATGWASAAGPRDRFTVGMVFVVRNVGIATAIAVTALGRVDFAVFATAYFLAQVPLLLLQPLVATILAIRSGLGDAREGRPVFFWTLALKPAQRRTLLRHLWQDVGKLFLVACVLDVVYQLLVLHWVYPVQTVIVATALAILPYLVFRGLANRLRRRLGSKKSEKEGDQ